MNTLRVLSTVLVFAAGIALIFGSAGFSSVAVDRGVAISVVEDENAYVGMTVCDQPATNSSGHLVEIRVQNRFGADLTIDTIEGGLETGPPNTVGPDDAETFRIRVENDTEEVTLFAHTESVSVEMTREIRNQSTSTCEFTTE